MLILMVVNVLATGAYFFHGAESFDEYLQDIYLTVSLVVTLTMLIIKIVLMPKVFKLIENLNGTIDESEYTLYTCQIRSSFWSNLIDYVLGVKNPVSKTIHNQTKQQIEKHFRRLDIILVKATPVCVTLPMFIISFVAYFTTDIGADAFELPVHMW